jgi:signal transduction histidine kinase
MTRRACRAWLVDRELARARIKSDRHTVEADPAVILSRLIKVLRRTPKGAEIDWQTRMGNPAPRARIDPDGLTEALGALLENAMQHADAAVEAVISQKGDRVTIAIFDDGPGVPDGALARLPHRGMRLDESGKGQGIGLAIVSDIAEAARGQLSLTNTCPGLCVELTLAVAAPRR